jgi:hypothetical protein
MGRTARRSPQLRGDSNPSRPRSSSWTFTNRNGDRRCTPAPIRSSDTERPESSCDMMLFGGIKLLRPVFVGCGLPLFII